MNNSLQIIRKITPYAPLLLLLTLSFAITNVNAAISPYSPADACYLVPNQVIYTADTECQYNGTTFTVELIAKNFTEVAGFQIKINYNSTLLYYENEVGYNFDTDPANPMSPTQMAPLEGGRVDTDVSVPGSVQIATVWKAATPTYTYSGNSTMAEITFMIIYCPPQTEIDNMVSCVLDTVAGAQGTKLVDDLGDDILFTNIYDGYYEYTTLGAVPEPPVADFTWSPTSPLIGETVTFDASSSTPDGGTIVSYRWNFGDLNVTTVSVPVITHVYENYGTGNRTVTLNVTDSEGEWDTEIKTVTLQPPGTPVADFTWSPQRPLTGDTVTFDASISNPNGGTIVSYEWNFGDGNLTTVDVAVTTHVYTDTGVQYVQLKVLDSEGLESSLKTREVRIYAGTVGGITMDPLNATIDFVGDNVTIDIIITNVADCAGYQFWIDYDSTILNMTSWTFDTGTPLTESQMAPPELDRVVTDVSVAGSVKLAIAWMETATPYTFSGASVAARITFEGLEVGTSDLTINQAYTRAVDSLGDDLYFVTFDDGFVQVIPEFSVAFILPLLMAATLAALFLAKMTRSKRRRN